MKTPLASIRDCFEGVIPSVIATLDAAGQPNVSYLSQVYLVDAEHVALSNQFFSKTAANVAATGRAHVLVVSGRTGAQFALDVEHRASLAEGPVFDKMSAQLTAISSQHGVGDAMVLRSAELYWVSECRAILGPPMLAETVPSPTAQDRGPGRPGRGGHRRAGGRRGDGRCSARRVGRRIRLRQRHAADARRP